MSLYQCDPDAQLVGQTVLALFENIQYLNMAAILEENGISLGDIDPEGWYPLQPVLDVLYQVSQQGTAMSDLVSIGITAAELSPLTPEMEALPLGQFLKLYGEVYQMRHRGSDLGEVHVAQAGLNHLRITLNGIPYPDDVFYGLFYGYARRLLNKGIYWIVEYDPHQQRRADCGEKTIINIQWESSPEPA